MVGRPLNAVLLILLAVCLVYHSWLGIQVVVEDYVGGKGIKVVVLLLSGIALIYAATSNGKLLWVRETLNPARPFGPYVNPNHFGGIMELAVPWLLGYSWWRFRKGGLQALKEPQAPVALGAGDPWPLSGELPSMGNCDH